MTDKGAADGPKSAQERLGEKSRATAREPAIALPIELIKPADPLKAPLIRGRDEGSRSQDNPIFDLLVKEDSDLAGLLAYSLHELNKRDWLRSFARTHQRDPTREEFQAFLLGERMERRLATYRQQGEAALADRSMAGNMPTLISKAPAERPGMATILNQWRRSPSLDAIKASGAQNADPGPAQPSLKAMLRYFLILSALVGLLAILVNYAQTTIFAQ